MTVATVNGVQKVSKEDTIEKRREIFDEFVTKLAKIARTYGYLASDAGKQLQHLRLLEPPSQSPIIYQNDEDYFLPYRYRVNSIEYVGCMFFTPPPHLACNRIIEHSPEQLQIFIRKKQDSY